MRCCGSCGLIVHRSIHPSLPLEAIYLIEVTQRIGRSTDVEILVSEYTILYKRTKIVLNCNDILMNARMEISISITMCYIFRDIQKSKKPNYCQWILQTPTNTIKFSFYRFMKRKYRKKLNSFH
jgi:hypothetical protein